MLCLVSIEKKGIRQFTSTKLLETIQYKHLTNRNVLQWSSTNQLQ